MAQWTAATTYQRFQEILEQEIELPFDSIDGEVMTLDQIKATFEKRIVRDAMPSGARHNQTRPIKPTPAQKDMAKGDGG